MTEACRCGMRLDEFGLCPVCDVISTDDDEAQADKEENNA